MSRVVLWSVESVVWAPPGGWALRLQSIDYSGPRGGWGTGVWGVGLVSPRVGGVGGLFNLRCAHASAKCKIKL
jgi:hypothetical protein